MDNPDYNNQDFAGSNFTPGVMDSEMTNHGVDPNVEAGFWGDPKGSDPNMHDPTVDHRQQNMHDLTVDHQQQNI